MSRHVYHPRRQAESLAGKGRADVSFIQLPLLQGMFMSEIHLGRGEGLPPHGHPDTDELCYVIAGEISYSVVDPAQNQNQCYHVTSGQIVHAPVGWCHWVTSLTPETILLLMYNAGNPHQIDAAPIWSYSVQLHDEQMTGKYPFTPVPLVNVKKEEKTSEARLPAAPLLLFSKQKQQNHK